jgi:adiponectin receptor
MVCTSPSLTVESYEDISTAKTSSSSREIEGERQKPDYRRRHSSFHPRRKSADSMDGEEGLLLRVCPYFSADVLRILTS